MLERKKVCHYYQSSEEERALALIKTDIEAHINKTGADAYRRLELAVRKFILMLELKR